MSKGNPIDETLEIAKNFPRIKAFVIDYIVVGLITSILVLPTELTEYNGADALAVGGIIALLVLYFIVAEAEWGYTIGKKEYNLLVVNEDGSEIGYKKSIIRNLIKFVEVFYLPFIALLFIWYTDRQQRLGDLLANTLVINRQSYLDLKEREDES